MSSSPKKSHSSSTSENEGNEDPTTFKDTSSSSVMYAADKLQQLLDKVPMLKPDEVLSKKPSATASKPIPVPRDPGDSARLLQSGKEAGQITFNSRNKRSRADPYMPSAHPIQQHSADHTSSSQQSSSTRQRQNGAPSERSGSQARRAAARPVSSTTASTPQTFTLYQASQLPGLTATQHSVFSYLTSIRAPLLAKWSCASWTDILSSFQSKEAMFMLDGLSSLLRRTTLTMRRARRSSGDASATEAFSASQRVAETIPNDSSYSSTSKKSRVICLSSSDSESETTSDETPPREYYQASSASKGRRHGDKYNSFVDEEAEFEDDYMRHQEWQATQAWAAMSDEEYGTQMDEHYSESSPELRKQENLY